MTTIYFAFFCLLVAFIVFIAFKNDDHDEFYGASKDKRFSMQKAKTIKAKKSE